MHIISANSRLTKTLGPKEASFLIGLHEINKTTFALKDAAHLTGLTGQSLRNFVHHLAKKGILTSLSHGLYNIVPFELGEEKIYAGNPFIIAKELVKKKSQQSNLCYYISHGSAMDLHRMVTQPQLIVYTTVTHQIRQKNSILGTEYRFITTQERNIFGTKKMWVTNFDSIVVSDMERTVIDGLKMPKYCGGLIEVAKGFWMKRDEMNMALLVDYALLLGVGSVYRRLGYLLDIYQINCPGEIDRLLEKITRSYSLLDPTLIDEGEHSSKWKLRLNIPEDEFLTVIRS